MQESPRRKMVEYFKKNLKKGYPEDSLRFSLLSQGYSRTSVDISLQIAHQELASEAPVLKEKPIIKHKIIGEDDRPIRIKKPWWKRIFG